MSVQETTDYPFHTTADAHDKTEFDKPQVGIMFMAGSGQFYEFQNPEHHDDYERYVDPRTGDVVTFDGPLDRAKRVALGGCVRSIFPADQWADFRETYVNADSDRLNEVQRQFRDRHAEWLDQRWLILFSLDNGSIQNPDSNHAPKQRIRTVETVWNRRLWTHPWRVSPKWILPRLCVVC